MGDLADIDLVIGPYKPSNKDITDRFNILQADEFLKRSSRYDSVIYQVSNSFHDHRYMIPCMKAVPGVVVLHDYSVYYLVLGMTVRDGNLRALHDILESSYGDESWRIATKLLLSMISPYEIALSSALIGMSEAVIVHNRYTQEKVLRDSPAKKVGVIPMGIAEHKSADSPEMLRQRFGCGENDFVIVTAGSSSYTKRLGLILSSLKDVMKKFSGVRFMILGGGRLDSESARTIKELSLEDEVVRTGWVSKEEYLDRIQIADLVVDMRYPSGGETSASISRAIAAGKPVIVSAQGSFLELPDEFCIKVPVGGNEVENLSRAIGSLIAEPGKRAEMGRAAKEFSMNNMSLKGAAEAYLSFVRETIDSEADRVSNAAPLLERSLPGERALVSVIYRFFRIGYLWRTYGFMDAVRRIREEIHLSAAKEQVDYLPGQRQGR